MSKLRRKATKDDHLSAYTRRDFLTVFGSGCQALGVSSLIGWSKPRAAGTEHLREEGRAQHQLFPTSLDQRRWLRFPVAGFSDPVSGVIFRGSNPPCCGLGVGGLDTGCMDVDVRGVYAAGACSDASCRSSG
jgi:hypothetical protein